MLSEAIIGVLIGVVVGICLAVLAQAVIFIFDVPKQLKRIADALEKEQKDGK